MVAFPGTLHLYSHPLTAFEFQPSSPSEAQDDDSTVIFVGGLFDNLATVALSYPVAKQLPPGWRFVQAMLSSSGIGWGTSNLDKDVEEMGKLVSYLRKLRPNGKVVLFGHSTGSQDVMHYVVSELGAETRPKVDGAILQGSISDREGFSEEMDPEMLKSTVKLAQEMVAEGKGEETLPRLLLKDWCPCTANRWLSLMSPGPDHAGQDDLFSSDLSEERLQGTFGKVGRSGVPLLILYSAEDQYVPKYVDRDALVGKWTRIVKENGGIVHDQSGLIPGMDHSGSGASEEAKLGLASRVVAFVQSL